MPKELIEMQGLPASGKTTRAIEIIKQWKDTTILRVCRDDIRAQMFGSDKGTLGKREKFVSEMEDAIVRAGFLFAHKVIIDDMNLRGSSHWKDMAGELGVNYRVERLCTPIQDCLIRDSQRRLGGKRWVGSWVIYRKALDNKLLPSLDSQRPKVVIVDIDGTLADPGDRLEWLKVCHVCKKPRSFHAPGIQLEEGMDPHEFTEPMRKNHEVFYSLVSQDMPRWTIIKWVRKLKETYTICIVSGRTMGIAGKETERWLYRWAIPYDYLFMRPSEDFRPDTDMKQRILDRMYENWYPGCVEFAIDDRPSICAMWRSNGVRVFPVGDRDEDF